MTKLESYLAMSDSARNIFDSGVAHIEHASSSRRIQNQQGWDKIVSERLEQMEHMLGLDNDGLIAPTQKCVDMSLNMARQLRSSPEVISPPDRVVPNGDGGIVFEWMARELFCTIEVDDDGAMEYTEFRDSKLIRREPVILPISDR